ncbi:SMP-30/gluconolactonase/LRE family protein [Aquincola sp. S2]|uniref:SMP-30/gluconolactonase/LRE family protein n=1 Tax=Pseudaquabacterium terrae TaxID=2732868 RepID=A0ABX2EB06_9BURK|nr:SMP-30/gluconolactonase/LRE family protein [Aquabacterium terrae]NRF65932.1 SMP-30/gluconolactonase/LRE family protein [Aquabacterium terrae]
MRPRKILTALALVVLAPVAYLTLWPVPVAPVAWSAAPPPGYAGPHAANQRLAALQHIDLKGDSGPEHVAIGRDGKLYTAVASGRLLRLNPDGSGLEVFAQPGGRILGFDFDAAGHLIGADPTRGLVSVAPDGQVTVLADQVDGDPIRFANAVVVARSGRIYFSDASTRFSARDLGASEAGLREILEGSASGRLLEYDPTTKRTRTLARGFSLANGVALSQDEQWLFVADTGRYRIWKIDVAGTAPPKVLLDKLPGYPDNLMRGRDGRIWVGLVKPRNAGADRLSDKPFVRKLIMRLPRSIWPLSKDHAHVFAFTEDGRVVADLQGPSGAYGETTGVTETVDRLYVTNLRAKTLGWLPRPAP